MNFPLRPESCFTAPRQGGKLQRQVYGICKRKRVSLLAHFYDFLMTFSSLRSGNWKVGGGGGRFFLFFFFVGGGG